MISIYYIKKQPRNNRKQKYGTFRNAERTHKHTGWIGLTDDEAASAIHRTFTMHSHPNSFMLIWRRLNTLTNVHTHTVHTRRLNELRFFFSYVEKLPLQPNSSSFSSSRVSKPGKRGEKRDFVRVSRAREQVLIYCNNGNTEARTFNLILKILFTKQRKNRFKGYILMYILVLFNEKKYQVTSLTEKGRSVSSVAKHDFFKETEKNTRLRLVEARIK